MNIYDLIICALIVYCFAAIFLIAWECQEDNFVTPRYFYDKGLNWFGSFLVFILLSVFSPLCLIYKLFYVIYKGIKWLLTVRR